MNVVDTLILKAHVGILELLLPRVRHGIEVDPFEIFVFDALACCRSLRQLISHSEIGSEEREELSGIVFFGLADTTNEFDLIVVQ